MSGDYGEDISGTDGMEADTLPLDEKKLLLQALFRPASDGIVKEEGLPHPALDFMTKMGGR